MVKESITCFTLWPTAENQKTIIARTNPLLHKKYIISFAERLLATYWQFQTKNLNGYENIFLAEQKDLHKKIVSLEFSRYNTQLITLLLTSRWKAANGCKLSVRGSKCRKWRLPRGLLNADWKRRCLTESTGEGERGGGDWLQLFYNFSSIRPGDVGCWEMMRLGVRGVGQK